MRKVAMICPYFGKFPTHFQFWLNSLFENGIDWFIFTDDKTEYSYPQNVKVNYITFDEIKEYFESRFGEKISLTGTYKLGDLKPFYGFLFQEYIQDYDSWGYCDVPDIIYGNIRKFLTDELMNQYDKIMLFGHMSIYKNTQEVNERFQMFRSVGINYHDIIRSKSFFNFEEISENSIFTIYQTNNIPIGRLDDYIADLSQYYDAFIRSEYSDDYKSFYDLKKRYIFRWKNGKLLGYYLEDNQVKSREFMYVHFKRKKLEIQSIVNQDDYYIVPNMLISNPSFIIEPSVSFIKHYTKFCPLVFNRSFQHQKFMSMKKMSKNIHSIKDAAHIVIHGFDIAFSIVTRKFH